MFVSTTRRNVSLLIKGGVVAAALALLAGCSEGEGATNAQEIVRPVKVVEVGEPDQGRRLEYSGSVKARTEMNLGFRVGGKITERLVDVGDRVGPGDVLAKLDAVDYQLALRRAEADLASATKQEEISELARRRAQSLFSKNIASKSELEQATLTHDQAVSAQQSAASALEEARNQVAYTELRSGQNGIVTSVSADIGQVVGSGTPVVTVAVDGGKEVQIAVPEVDIGQFRPGKTVKSRFWSDPDLVLEGSVREVAGSADAQSRTFAVRVSLPENPRVLLGMTATIEAIEDNAVPGYAIPLAALGEKDGKAVVWVVDRQAGTVRSQPVTVGAFSDHGVRISEGLSTGDVVVSAGTQFMKEDMKVKLPEIVSSRFGNVNSMSTASVKP